MFKKSEKGFYFWEEFAEIGGLVHGFSTRHFGSIKNNGKINEKNLKKFLDILRVERKSAVFAEQIHGSNIAFIKDIKNGLIRNTDGLITNKKGIFLCIVTADCLPVIFYDPKIGTVGIVHAGYRGLLRGILQKMIKGMKKIGADVKNMKIAIGPAIGVCCYDVSSERVKMFEETFKGIKTYKIINGKYFLDLKNIAKQTLILDEIQEKNIEVSNICTKDNMSDFYSFRGEHCRDSFGLSVAVIGKV